MLDYTLIKASAVKQFNTIIEIGNFLQPLFSIKENDLTFEHALKAALIDRNICDEKTLKILKTNLFDGNVQVHGQPVTMAEFEDNLPDYFNVIAKLIILNFENFFLLWKKEEEERKQLKEEANNPDAT